MENPVNIHSALKIHKWCRFNNYMPLGLFPRSFQYTTCTLILNELWRFLPTLHCIIFVLVLLIASWVISLIKLTFFLWFGQHQNNENIFYEYKGNITTACFSSIAISLGAITREVIFLISTLSTMVTRVRDTIISICICNENAWVLTYLPRSPHAQSFCPIVLLAWWTQTHTHT